MPKITPTSIRVLASLIVVLGAAACTNKSEPIATSAPSAQSAPSGGQSTSVQNSTTESRFDPLAGDYPQLTWMINVMEVDRPVSIARDGSIEVATNADGAKPMWRTFAGSAVQKIFNSANAVPGYRFVSAPVVMNKPDTTAEISVGSLDKARASTEDFSARVKGTVAGEIVVSEVECMRGAGMGRTSQFHVTGMRVAPGGGIVIVSPLPSVEQSTDPQTGQKIWSSRWQIVTVRPTILRSVNDYPFQTSTALKSD